MKNTKSLIAALSALCLLVALVAFFLPNQHGMALSYLTMALAGAVGILCLSGMLRLFLRGE